MPRILYRYHIIKVVSCVAKFSRTFLCDIYTLVFTVINVLECQNFILMTFLLGVKFNETSKNKNIATLHART